MRAALSYGRAWGCTGLPPWLPPDGRAFLPEHGKSVRIVGVTHFKITRIVASLTPYRSARSKVQQCCCHVFTKCRGLGRFELQEAFCLWLGFTAALCLLAPAGFVLLPHLSLSSQFERGHPVFIRVHVRALTLLEERQPVTLKHVIIFLLLDDSHTIFPSLLNHRGTLGEIVTGCG